MMLPINPKYFSHEPHIHIFTMWEKLSNFDNSKMLQKCFTATYFEI